MVTWGDEMWEHLSIFLKDPYDYYMFIFSGHDHVRIITSNGVSLCVNHITAKHDIEHDWMIAVSKEDFAKLLVIEGSDLKFELSLTPVDRKFLRVSTGGYSIEMKLISSGKLPEYKAIMGILTKSKQHSTTSPIINVAEMAKVTEYVKAINEDSYIIITNGCNQAVMIKGSLKRWSVSIMAMRLEE